MAPGARSFEAYRSEVVEQGLAQGKRVECLCWWHDSLLAGFQDGSIHFYKNVLDPVHGERRWQVAKVHRSLERKAVVQMAAVASRPMLLSLTDEGVNLRTLPDMSLKFQAMRSKGASCFAWTEDGQQLAVAVKRKVILYQLAGSDLREISETTAPDTVVCMTWIGGGEQGPPGRQPQLVLATKRSYWLVSAVTPAGQCTEICPTGSAPTPLMQLVSGGRELLLLRDATTFFYSTVSPSSVTEGGASSSSAGAGAGSGAIGSASASAGGASAGAVLQRLVLSRRKHLTWSGPLAGIAVGEHYALGLLASSAPLAALGALSFASGGLLSSAGGPGGVGVGGGGSGTSGTGGSAGAGGALEGAEVRSLRRVADGHVAQRLGLPDPRVSAPAAAGDGSFFVVCDKDQSIRRLMPVPVEEQAHMLAELGEYQEALAMAELVGEEQSPPAIGASGPLEATATAAGAGAGSSSAAGAGAASAKSRAQRQQQLEDQLRLAYGHHLFACGEHDEGMAQLALCRATNALLLLRLFPSLVPEAFRDVLPQEAAGKPLPDVPEPKGEALLSAASHLLPYLLSHRTRVMAALARQREAEDVEGVQAEGSGRGSPDSSNGGAEGGSSVPQSRGSSVSGTAGAAGASGGHTNGHNASSSARQQQQQGAFHRAASHAGASGSGRGESQGHGRSRQPPTGTGSASEGSDDGSEDEQSSSQPAAAPKRPAPHPSSTKPPSASDAAAGQGAGRGTRKGTGSSSSIRHVDGPSSTRQEVLLEGPEGSDADADDAPAQEAAAARVLLGGLAPLRLLTIIDTAIVAVMVVMPDTGALLRFVQLPNYVDLREGEKVLSSSGMYAELAALYKYNGQHVAGMELLRTLSQAQETLPVAPRGAAYDLPGLPGVWAAVRYLVSLNERHAAIIQQHSGWVLQADPEAGLTAFLQMQPPLNPSLVLSILSTHSRHYCAMYLEAALEMGVALPQDYHSELLLLYLDDLLGQQQEEEAASARARAAALAPAHAPPSPGAPGSPAPSTPPLTAPGTPPRIAHASHRPHPSLTPLATGGGATPGGGAGGGVLAPSITSLKQLLSQGAHKLRLAQPPKLFPDEHGHGGGAGGGRHGGGSSSSRRAMSAPASGGVTPMGSRSPSTTDLAALGGGGVAGGSASGGLAGTSEDGLAASSARAGGGGGGGGGGGAASKSRAMSSGAHSPSIAPAASVLLPPSGGPAAATLTPTPSPTPAHTPVPAPAAAGGGDIRAAGAGALQYGYGTPRTAGAVQGVGATLVSPKQRAAAEPTLYQRLRDLVYTSPYINPDYVLSKLPPGQLLEIRALMLERLGRHREALRLYVHGVQDLAAAEVYCDRVFAAAAAAAAASTPSGGHPPPHHPPAAAGSSGMQQPQQGASLLPPPPNQTVLSRPGDIYLELMHAIYDGPDSVDFGMGVGLTPPGMHPLPRYPHAHPHSFGGTSAAAASGGANDGGGGGGGGAGSARAHVGTHPGQSAAALDGASWRALCGLLARKRGRVEWLEVMASLPSEVPLADVLPVVSGALRHSVEERRQLAVMRQLRRCENLTAREELTRCRQQRVLVTAERACSLCHKRLGGAVFVVYPGGALSHYLCHKRQQGGEPLVTMGGGGPSMGGGMAMGGGGARDGAAAAAGQRPFGLSVMVHGVGVR